MEGVEGEVGEVELVVARRADDGVDVEGRAVGEDEAGLGEGVDVGAVRGD